MVAAEVADALGAPLDVLVVRKIGAPGRPELAMGALAAGTEVRNADVVHALGIDDVTFAAAAEAERARAQARERTYRGIHPATPLDGPYRSRRGRRAGHGSHRAGRRHGAGHRTDDRPQRVVLAVPVAPGDGLDGLSRLVDDVVCLSTPRPFLAVGEWYRDFAQVSDDEVRALLRRREVV